MKMQEKEKIANSIPWSKYGLENLQLPDRFKVVELLLDCKKIKKGSCKSKKV